MMVRLAGEDLVRPVELLDQHHARELVRERHRAERQPLVAALVLGAVRPADDEADVAPTPPAVLEPARERRRVVGPPAHVEQHAIAVRRDPALDLVALAQLDQLDARPAGQHLRVVLQVVRERRPDPADRDDGVLHRANASAIPMRWIVLGCVPSRKRTTAGGSGSETFLTAIRSWNAMNVRGSRVSSSENASARRSTSRESWFETIEITGATSASESATAGTARGPSAASRGASRSASTAAAHVPNGATSTSQINPLRTSRWCTCPSSCATTRRVSSGSKSLIRLS